LPPHRDYLTNRFCRYYLRVGTTDYNKTYIKSVCETYVGEVAAPA
jgi:hypothetical protein